MSEEVEPKENGIALKVFCVTSFIGMIIIIVLILAGVIPLYPIGPFPPP